MDSFIKLINSSKLESFKMEGFVDKKIASMHTAEIVGSTAILHVNNTLMRNPPKWALFYGVCQCSEMLKNQIKALSDNNNISKIIIAYDTPGGSVSGMFSLADEIFSARSKKEIISFVNGMACSAGYLTACAGSKIVLSDVGDTVGSIGVIYTHFDYSGMNEKFGIKVTHITAGEFKAVGSEDQPLSKEDKEKLQGTVNYYMDLFVEHVSKYRDMSLEEVKKFANGDVFIGKQAIDMRVADEINSMEAFVSMNMEEFKAGHPDLYNQVYNLGAESVDTGITLEKVQKHAPEVCESLKREGFEAGASSERERIQGIEKISKAAVGFDALIQEKKFDGSTTAKDISYEIMQKKAEVGHGFEALEGDSTPVDFSSTPNDVDPEKTKKNKRLEAAANAINKRRGK